MTLQRVQTTCMLSLNTELQAAGTKSYVCSQKKRNSLGTEISVITINQILPFLDDLYGL